ncbi:MAG TPA: alpha/beta hydrolase [Bauldia sp.]|nr:alpha/beta hydrolase [Bauldia sp.]
MSANKIIKTSHADIAISETSGKGLPVLFIHGNSSCKEVFRSQLESPLGETYRLIAMDLPGQGASSDAFDPARTYSIPGFADAAMELLERLGVERAAVVGWSLGGHVAIEMSARYSGMVGLLVAGAPPVSATMESIGSGFKPNPLVGLIGKEVFSDEEAEAFGQGTYGALFDDKLRAAIKRADGRLRRMTFENLLGGGPADQKQAAEQASMPIAFVNGADDPFVNLDYVGGLSYRSLWDQHCYVLRGVGHVAFMQAPEVFNPILTRFLADMQKRLAMPDTRKASKIVAA